MDYQELMALARTYYNKGGDVVYECWDEQTLRDFEKEFRRPMTKQDALNLFELYEGVRWG
jgi:hypothetical protein